MSASTPSHAPRPRSHAAALRLLTISGLAVTALGIGATAIAAPSPARIHCLVKLQTLAAPTAR
jgi:hypothetical protein